jgi:hypothetical protein
MRMIPATPYGTGSRAERSVFDYLREMKVDDQDANYTVAFHSLNLTRHPVKRFGEIDFLICGPRGIFVLEVKGGGVKCQDGQWIYTDRTGQEHQRSESPFRQAETALHGLMKRLQERFPKKAIDQFVTGFGVVFPDCEWNQPGSEWDPHTLADAKAFRRFDKWIVSLFSYWQGKAFGAARTSVAPIVSVKELQTFLRPDFEAIVPLGIQVQRIEDNLVRLTEDQFAWIDVVEANPRTLCIGGAGTGKTFLAAELARRWTANGSNVLLVCASPWLRSWLEGQIALKGLTISSCDAVSTIAKRHGISQFDALIVDEAQDLMQIASLDVLDSHLRGSLTNGKWCMFGDFQNQSGLVALPEQDAIQWIDQLAPVRLPLHTNCRNTSEIIDAIKTRLGADMGTRGTGNGPAVIDLSAQTREDGAKLLGAKLADLLGQGMAYSQITILSPLAFKESISSLLSDRVKQTIRALDQYGIRSFPPDAVSYSRIQDFKGLENDVIILVDLSSSSDADVKALTYVGMSRARAILCTISVLPS